jgi:hypothetical protein
MFISDLIAKLKDAIPILANIVGPNTQSASLIEPMILKPMLNV